MTNTVRSTAIAAATLAVIALSGCGSNDDTAAVQASIEALQSRVAALESAQAQIESRAQVLATSSATTLSPESTPASVPSALETSSSPASAAAPSASFEASVRRTGTLSRISGGADLDAPATEADWTGDTDDIQINSASSTISPLNGAQLLPLGKDAAGKPVTADLQTCASGSYTTQPVDLSGLYNGPGICVKTSDGRFAAMTYLSSYPYTFAVTSYEAPAG